MLNLSADAANKFLHINFHALITITIIISDITRGIFGWGVGAKGGCGKEGVAANARLSLGD